jgi:SIR2-like domain/NACHT domain
MNPETLVRKLKADLANGTVVTIAGTGIASAACGNQEIDGFKVATWTGLLHHGLAYCLNLGVADEADAEILKMQINSGKTSFLICAAEEISQRLKRRAEGIFRGWLSDTIGNLKAKNRDILDVIAGLPGVLATLNYDNLFEDATGRKAVTWLDKQEVQEVLLKVVANAVLHLHGWFKEPESVVLGLSSYLAVKADPHAQAVLQLFTIGRTLLFIGCGDTVLDPNFTRLLNWGNETLRDVPPRHYLLCRTQDIPLFRSKLADTAWIQPLGYGNEHDDLAPFLLSLVTSSSPNPDPEFHRTTTSIDEAAYREYLQSRYRYLQMETLGSDTMYRDISLQGVFIPQDARNCGDWRPEKLESPSALTLDASKESDRDLYGLSEHKRFRDTPARPIYEVMDAPNAKHRVLLGGPGAGKSTFTRICLLRWVETKETVMRPLPILIELRLFNRSGQKDFLDYLECDNEVGHHFSREAISARLSSGDAELIFDGLDEIFDDGERNTAALMIARYAREFKNARILVTSRLVGYPSQILRDVGFAHWLLADFNDDKIACFLDKWADDAIREASDRPIVRKRMEDALRNPVVRELAGNPLLLTLMTVLARKSDLPRDVASLYERAADLFLEKWDTHRMLAADVEFAGIIIDQKDKRDLLCNLAWKMLNDQKGLGGNLISGSEVGAAMDVAFKNRIPEIGLRRRAIKLLIEQLTERDYILCHVGGTHFSFVHRGFLDFFASDHLCNIIATQPSNALSLIRDIYHTHATQDEWREILILAATRFEPCVADELLLPLVRDANSRQVGTAACYEESHPFIIGVKVLVNARDPLRIVNTSNYIRASLKTWIGAESDFLDGDGWITLLIRCFPDDDTRSLLMELALRHEVSFTRLGAIVGLAEHFRVSESRDVLIQLARRDERTDARTLAIASLVKYFEDDQTRALFEDPQLRAEAADAPTTLAEYFGPEATRIRLTAMSMSSEDTDVRTDAIAALAQRFPDNTTRAVLVDLAHRDENTRARSQAMASLLKYFSDSAET